MLITIIIRFLSKIKIVMTFATNVTYMQIPDKKFFSTTNGAEKNLVVGELAEEGGQPFRQIVLEAAKSHTTMPIRRTDC